MAVYSAQHLQRILLLLLYLIVSAQAPPSAHDLHDRQLTTITTTATPTTTIPFNTPQSTACPNPCGYYGQICCGPDEYCYTDANNQAQCTSISTPPNSPTCPAYSTSTYTTIQTSLTTSTYVITYTRIQTDIQTIIGTASWQLLPQISDCCSPPPPPPQECNYALGETPCGEICCVSGQYCASAGQCVAIGGGSESGMWEFITTTYLQSDLQTVTATYSTYVVGTAPARPTSETLATATQTN